ncbi:hypothetical protein [Spartinivicinus poritis]|uniref:Secreted protein n=1 Tax=Spartinivicinus poritis TaxID=2994640 RepID=A0ABT5UI00_9GAMM|nr:hypothetical protein [Spartinivicinus sp. A2-2]MDE1466023.1 hypothetical protein [Spartinivicinus sp. A2-2]
MFLLLMFIHSLIGFGSQCRRLFIRWHPASYIETEPNYEEAPYKQKKPGDEQALMRQVLNIKKFVEVFS